MQCNESYPLECGLCENAKQQYNFIYGYVFEVRNGTNESNQVVHQ